MRRFFCFGGPYDEKNVKQKLTAFDILLRFIVRLFLLINPNEFELIGVNTRIHGWAAVEQKGFRFKVIGPPRVYWMKTSNDKLIPMNVKKKE